MFLALAIILVTVLFFALRPRRHKLAPPGPTGLPLLGSLLSLDAVRPHDSLRQIARKYGVKGACSVRLGSVPAVLLTDPKLVREAFAKDSFSGRAPLYLTHGIMEGKGIICAEGELWRDQRRLLSAWLRAMGATKTGARKDQIERRVSASVDKFEKRLASREDTQSPVDIQPYLADCLGNAINEIVFGVTFAETDRTWKWLLHIQEESVRHLGVAAIVNFMPYLRFFMSSIRKTINTIVSAQAQSHTILFGIVERRKAFLKAKAEGGEELINHDEKGIECIHYEIESNAITDVHYFKPSRLLLSEDDCILDYFLEEKTKRLVFGEQCEGYKRLSDRQMLFFLADLFGAGLDTTLVSLSWFILFMAVNPHEQDAVRKELLAECGSRPPTLEDLPRLPYTRAALSESQRLRPVVPLGIPHGCLEDTMIGDYMIEKGTMVVPLQWAIHTDEDEWEDPQVYKPSRFLGPEGDVLNPSHFIPFQTGKRMCPGDELARTMMFLFGGRLVARYELSIHGDPPCLDGVMGLTLSPPPFSLNIKSLAKA